MRKGYIAARTPRDIEGLIVWALVDNGLGRQFVESNGRFDWRDLGTRVDGGRSESWGVPLPGLKHDDASVVADAIMALPPAAAALVIHYGRTNSRPDWCEEGVGHAQVKTNRRGQVQWHYEVPGDRHSRKVEPVREWVGETPERVSWYRAQYVAWWEAMVALVEPLNRVLEKFEAMPPAIAREPWLRYGEGTPLADAMSGNSMGRRAVIERDGPIEMERELPVESRS